MIAMKKILFLTLLLCIAFLPGHALVSFKFEPGSASHLRTDLRASMESNTTALLTEIANAYNKNRKLQLAKVKMEENARTRLCAIWDSSYHFTPKMKTVCVKLVNDFQGYQARQVLVKLQPDQDYHGSLVRELTISFNRGGTITGVRVVDTDEVSPEAFLQGGITVDDLERRMEVLKWTEDFRSYYTEGNLQAIYDIFSDKAIIITGSVYTTRERSKDGTYSLKQGVKYSEQNRDQYCAKLAGIFRKGKVKVKFDRVSVRGSGTNSDCYGVTLHQTWTGPNGYHDEGWVFLLWDFSDPDKPQIHVRTWQPDEIITGEDQVLGLPDFFVPSH